MLLDRHTHEVSWHEVGGQFANTHFFNAYEQGDELIIDGHRITRLGTPTTRLELISGVPATSANDNTMF